MMGRAKCHSVHVVAAAMLMAAILMAAIQGRHATATECVHPQGNVSLDHYGDVNENGVTNVADSLCIIFVVLWTLDSQQNPPPPCLAGDLVTADLDCSGSLTVVDAHASIAIAVGLPLGVSDADGDGCMDACTACVGPSELSCLIAHTCLPEGFPHPQDACSGCYPTVDAVAYSPAPDGTACGLGLECIDHDCVPTAGTDEIPTNVTATAGNGQATVTWSPPPSPPAPVVGYQVSVYAPGGGPAAGVQGSLVRSTPVAPTQLVFTSLANGVAYAFTVRAVMTTGPGVESALSNTVTPGDVPSAPYNVVASGGDESATVSFHAPLQTNGLPISSYTVFVWPGGDAIVAAGPPVFIGGLVNGMPYSFTVAASNAAGMGPQSGPSNTIVPAALPSEPTILDGAGQDGQLWLSYLPPSDDGGAVAIWYVGVCESTDGTSAGLGVSATTEMIVPGLTNGKPHTCTVSAVNSTGEGPPSAPFGPVTPVPLIQLTGVLVARPVTALGSSLIDAPVGDAPPSTIVATPAGIAGDDVYDSPYHTPPAMSAIVAAAVGLVGDSDLDPEFNDVQDTGALVASPVGIMADSDFDTATSDAQAIGALVASPVGIMADTDIDPALTDAQAIGAVVARPIPVASDLHFKASVTPTIRGALVSSPAVAVGRPYVGSAAPDTVSTLGSSVAMTLTGIGLAAATNVAFYDSTGTLNASLTASALVIEPDGQSISFDVTISPSTPTGLWTVVVGTSAGFTSPVAPPTGQQAYDNVIAVIP